MKPIVQVEKLRLAFPGSKNMLFKDFSVSFNKGEKVLILGPSGCGKSTFLQLLSGIIPGSIDIPCRAEALEIPQEWGYVFQDPDAQFCMPYVDEEMAFVLENLQTPREKMAERMEELLSAVGIRLPALHTKIQSLSGGMKQRLAIASVLALKPEVLFLDEPTAMLDPEGTKDIWDTLKKVGRDKTVIIVEHKIDHVLDFAGRIILLDGNGNLMADGTKGEIFARHRTELREQGIWFPGVWEEYISQIPAGSKSIPANGKEVISLSDFKGIHGKEVKIHVDDLKVQAGEWVVITGKNGAGKSTFLHALMQFIKTKGNYLLKGKRILKGVNPAKEVAFVFQNPEFQFVAGTVYEETAFSLRMKGLEEGNIAAMVENTLRVFALEKQQHLHPYQLSTGQKRRLSVAASIIADPDILLLDEPTFGQDAKNTFAILDKLEEFRKKGAAIIMVSHDEQIVEGFATRVLAIDHGRIIKNEYILESERAGMTCTV
ncbi:ABC transporter ATP-binding protein [Mesobacillus zeae]|uniref:ATP-binding cassette domain-containing protein n=1 Tax=Mesobacillus zeae TaxID=1917180 RepID=A0A398BKJ8_9BACI|nr:ABC transporter ATP-binding protein [Mesobacillus zeae]RID88280.1 ATP-binding cassette domain-containing protein [Mesobacillus zeae]